MSNTLILFSSANPNGNTYHLTLSVLNRLNHSKTALFELDKLEYADYNYENTYPCDDFYLIAKKLAWADNIIFASPVYWHSVTSNMKRFIDRMTELTEQPDMKPIGKGLKDKHGYVLTTSASEHVCPVFKHFFVKIFSYFDIKMMGVLHLNCRDKFAIPTHKIDILINKINQKS